MSRQGMQVKALLSMGILVGIGAVSTLAAWTGTATATSTVSAATVALGVGKTATDSPTYTVPLSGSAWYPGMSQSAVVVVKNSSSIAVTYTISGSTTETGGGKLGNALNVVVTDGAIAGSAPNAICEGTPLLSKGATQPFPTAQPRPSLAPGASETLCVQYSLPTSAANTLQGNSTTVKLTFTASVGS
ncbi:hypothetical protein CQ018_06070 [Arthrobacter sp. MYb227]|uniref:hypothetical protein n=1 Tax=Arthrobacter sp. MYb227 TaxID=1848601 RepID=UPI000CFD645B|nr:hypothetical protein [Arthrobacter sp. MYb227]PQZ94904.1 hypothetical protein CQ018_06070 [Arthrobacter sp. MYb227]